MARPFISYDGTDPQGRRAEVVVEVHTGTIKGVEEMDKVAKITFNGDGLSNPVQGYIQLDDPVLDIIKEAKKTKETVEYRIEIVRKPGIDRSIPMTELRKDMEVARNNVKKIIAGINGTLTKEAVTDPAEDSGGNGVYKATETKNAPVGSPVAPQSSVSPEQALAALDAAIKAGVPHEAISAMVASSILAGVEPQKVLEVAYPQGNNAPNTVHQTRSREEPVFRRYNTDGTLNLGSSQVIAGVSSENFARRILAPINTSENFAETVEKIASIVLAIADRIQVEAYGNTGNADRMAGSHTRIRGVIYDVIENTFLPPVLEGNASDEDLFKWVGQVGKATRERFQSAIKISESQFDFASLRPSTNAEKKVEQSAQVTETPASTPVASEPAPAVANEQSQETVDEDIDEDMDFELFEITAVPQPNPQVPSTALVNKLKKMITEFGVANEDLPKVGSLLEYSFGVHLAKEVPADNLKEFIAFYSEHGKENFHSAIRNVDELLGK